MEELTADTALGDYSAQHSQELLLDAVCECSVSLFLFVRFTGLRKTCVLIAFCPGIFPTQLTFYCFAHTFTCQECIIGLHNFVYGLY